MRYYKGNRTWNEEGGYYYYNIPCSYSALNTTSEGETILKCDPTEEQHTQIIANGFTEILVDNLYAEVVNMFDGIYTEEEIAVWKDSPV